MVYQCGKCGEECGGVREVARDSCQQWFHQNCESISNSDFQFLKECPPFIYLVNLLFEFWWFFQFWIDITTIKQCSIRPNQNCYQIRNHFHKVFIKTQVLENSKFQKVCNLVWKYSWPIWKHFMHQKFWIFEGVARKFTKYCSTLQSHHISSETGDWRGGQKWQKTYSDYW